MSFLKLLISTDRKSIVIAGLIGLLSGAANAKLIALVSDSLTAMNEGGSTSWKVYGAVTMVALVSGVVAQVFLIHLAERMSLNLRLNMCREVLRLPLRKLEETGEAKLVAGFTNDIPSVLQAILQAPTLFVNVAVTLGCLVYLGYLMPGLMVFLLGFIVMALISYIGPERFAARWMGRHRDAWDRLLDQFKAANEGAKELKLHYRRQEAFFNQIFRDTADEMRHAGFVNRSLYAVLDNWAQLMYFLFIAGMLFVYPHFQSFEPAAFAGFALVVLYVFGPVGNLVDAIPKLRQADIAYNRLQRLGMGKAEADDELYPDHQNMLAKIDNAPPLESIELRGVQHTFYREKEDSHFTLGPMDVKVKAGELVFIVGGNGSGKTTLAKLICGLYRPEAGQVLLNGEVVDDERLVLYRQYFSAIFTNFYIFEQILGMVKPELDAQALGYLKKLHLDHKVTIENGRLSTTDLSSGQRKRLALLTAYLEDRPIYLFDEWASDQDPEFKQLFYRVLLPELRAAGKTVFVISHDDRYFDVADRIIKLADGQLETVAQEVVAVG